MRVSERQTDQEDEVEHDVRNRERPNWDRVSAP